MPAKSESQQRLMGMALAAKRGKGHFGKKIHEIANSMSEKQLRDFAKTKHEGLAEKKAFEAGFFKRASEYGYSVNEAIDLLKSAATESPTTKRFSPGAVSYAGAGKGNNPVRPAPPVGVSDASPAEAKAYRLPKVPPQPKPEVSAAQKNEALLQPGARSYLSTPPVSEAYENEAMVQPAARSATPMPMPKPSILERAQSFMSPSPAAKPTAPAPASNKSVFERLNDFLTPSSSVYNQPGYGQSAKKNYYNPAS